MKASGLGLAFGALALVTLVGAAQAVAPPDSARMQALRATLASGALIGIVTTRTEVLRRRLTLDDAGIAIPATEGRAALIVAGTPPPERRIAWEKIDRIERVKPRGLIGTAIGAAIGGGLGALWLGTHGPDLFESGDRGGIAFAVLLTAMSGTTGMILGLANPQRHTLYP